MPVVSLWVRLIPSPPSFTLLVEERPPRTRSSQYLLEDPEEVPVADLLDLARRQSTGP